MRSGRYSRQRYFEQPGHDEKQTNNNIHSARPILRFTNLAFLVMPGAALVFDMPETLFGPNDRVSPSVTNRDSRIESWRTAS